MHSHLSVHRAQITAAQQSRRPECYRGRWLRGLSSPGGDAVAVPVAVAGVGGEPGRGSGLHAVLLRGLAPHPCHLVDLHRGLRRVVNVHLHQGGVHGGWTQWLGQRREAGTHLLKRAHHPWDVQATGCMPPSNSPSISSLSAQTPGPLPSEDRMEPKLLHSAPSSEGPSLSTSKLPLLPLAPPTILYNP